MTDTFNVLIVGAGIVGSACALELARTGLNIGILECDTPGSGATAAGMGHIVVMDDNMAQLQLTRYSQELWNALVQDNEAAHEYTRCGTIWIAADDEEMQAVHEKQKTYTTHAIPSKVLDSTQLYELEPQLRPGLAGGLLVPDDGVVYPPRSAMLLLNLARQYRVTLLHGTATRLISGGICLDDGRVIQAEQVVLANGARVVDLLPDIQVFPRKGHLVITDRYPHFIKHQLVELGYIKKAHASNEDTVSFNVQPRSTGQLLIGSSRQNGNGNREIDHHILNKMLACALTYLPGLAQCLCIRAWTGLRAATPDGLPLIGPHPRQPGIWLATGHEGLGITTSLATAHLLTARLLGQDTAIPIAPYLPARNMQEVTHE